MRGKRLGSGTVRSPYIFGDWSDAFDLCRELNRPIVVRVHGEMSRIYPSGKEITIG
jgi:hypothetical protein